ncbi:MAG: hypothetical protein WC421_01470 [Elusimicrobiales bacterium]
MIKLLLRRRAQSAFNRLVSMSLWDISVRAGFSLAGLLILALMYYWFGRALGYLYGVSIIGPLLPWKMTAMLFLAMFTMVGISGLISAMTTLYYSDDLKFLFSSPIPARLVFFDKAVETAVYSSWTLVAVMLPFVLALGRAEHASVFFYLYFAVLLIPFVLLGAAGGMALSMALMWFFPTGRTRDTVWLLGSLAMVLAYMMLRFSQPELLLNPGAMEVVSRYLQYLQAPTAPYLPSWWLVGGMQAFLFGKYAVFAKYVAALFGSVLVVYGALAYLSKWTYLAGFNGAQEGMRQNKPHFSEPVERKLFRAGLLERVQATLLWKDRRVFMRDMRYWSQAALIAAIMAVYLFSIRKLPLESADLKSLIAFFNIAIAGFVVAAIGLRFTFPAVSLEGRSFWLLRAAPVPLASVMREKLVLWALPSALVGITLVAVSNILLKADFFVSALGLGTIAAASAVCCVMGVGLGAVFPRFDVENIHQVESSAGGFVYMACCVGYLAAVISLEAYPVRMHFYNKFYSAPWDMRWLSLCIAGYVLVNILAVAIPWKMGRKNLENYEI